MRVIHVAPSVFGPDGLYGGGERYPLELARALAAEVDCELVTFGRRPGGWREPGGLRVRGVRPLCWLHGPPPPPAAPRCGSPAAAATTGARPSGTTPPCCAGWRQAATWPSSGRCRTPPCPACT